MEEFLRDLVTPEMRRSINEKHLSKEERLEKKQQSKSINFDEHVFIRPNSLKALKLSRHISITTIPMTNRSIMRTPKHQGENSLFTEQINDKGKEKERKSSFVGLRPNHPLLQGYNLDDTRQEIFMRTCRYNFEEGFLKLYEERWCFDDTNKCMEMAFNGNKLTLCCPRRQTYGIGKHIRLITKNDISLRIFNDLNECAKVVINYPNGLSIYYHTTHVEQLWPSPESFNGERRRIYTPYGAIIVFNEIEEIHSIFRYNGEVYELLQYELPSGEEEEYEFTGEDEMTSSSETLIETQNQKNVATENERGTSKSKSAPSKSSVDSEQSRARSSYRSRRSLKKSLEGYLKESITDELRFLADISAIYGLSYLHLRVTTSVGRVINMTRKGKVYEGRGWSNVEWHDYFANESYCMRGDGTKMIWTKDVLKCYHKEGTVFTTKTEEGQESGVFDDFETYISDSSSHQQNEEEEEEDDVIRINVGQLTASELNIQRTLLRERKNSLESNTNVISSKQTYQQQNYVAEPFRQKTTYNDYFMDYGEGEEEGVEEDPSYVSYTCDSYDMQHKHYAAVYIVLLKNFMDDVSVYMEVNAADNIRVQIERDQTIEDQILDKMEIQGENYIGSIHEHLMADEEQNGNVRAGSRISWREDTRAASKFSLRGSKMSSRTSISKTDANKNPAAGDEAEEEFETPPDKALVKLWVGEDFAMGLTEESCEIIALLERYEEERDNFSDTLQLSFKFTAAVTDLFKEFIEHISGFKNYIAPKSKDLFFIEKTDEKCHMKGFEFYDEVPTLSTYTFEISNTVTELKKFQSVHEKMENVYDWFIADMKKFPRFPKRSRKRPDPRREFPMICSVNVFIKIPRLLINTEDIHKFMDPFDTITFKKIRHQIREALDYYLRPGLRLALQKLISKKSWQRRQEEHRRRLFVEQQRTGLYRAMLKHKVYPLYFKFITDYRGHVRHIDFFDFMRYKCMDKIMPMEKHVKTTSILAPHSHDRPKSAHFDV